MPRLLSRVVPPCDDRECRSGGDAGCVDVGVDEVVDDAQGLAQGLRGWSTIGGERGSQEPIMDLGVEERDALPVTGQDVGVAVREPG